jgi:hypothetical protein
MIEELRKEYHDFLKSNTYKILKTCPICGNAIIVFANNKRHSFYRYNDYFDNDVCYDCLSNVYLNIGNYYLSIHSVDLTFGDNAREWIFLFNYVNNRYKCIRIKNYPDSNDKLIIPKQIGSFLLGA